MPELGFCVPVQGGSMGERGAGHKGSQGAMGRVVRARLGVRDQTGKIIKHIKDTVFIPRQANQ